MRLSRQTLNTFFPLLVLLVTVIAYLPVTRATFIWDDDDYLTENTIYDSPTALQDIWFKPSLSPQYYPVVFTMFYVEHAIYGGFNALGYHLVNVVLHAANAILLWLVLRRLRIPGAMLAAVIFAVHPLMAESVAWVTERKNTLSLLFFLSSLLAYLRFGFRGKRTGDIKPADWQFYALSLLLYILALLSKSVACGLAPVLVLLIWWKRPRKTLLQYLLTIPYFLLGAAAGIYTIYLELHHVGAIGKDWELSPVQRVLLASRDLWFYLYKILLPVNLSLYYDRWTIDPAVWWQWLFPVGVVAVLVTLVVLMKRSGRGPLAAVLAFIALAFPAMGFFSIYPFMFSWVADHFVYHASIALIALFAACATLIARRLAPGRMDMRILAAIPVIAVLGIITTQTAGNFATPETLWSSVIAYNPEHPNFNALAGMSSVLSRQAAEAKSLGDKQLADDLMEKAHDNDVRSLQERPDNPVIYNNFTSYYLYKGELDKALENALKAVELSRQDPRMHAQLSKVYEQRGEMAKAVEEARIAVDLQPRRVINHIRMARLLVATGQEQLAKQYLANVLKLLQPRNSDAHLLLGYIFMQHDQVLDAIAEFRAAVEVNPDNLEAQDSLARAIAKNPLATQADFQQAMDSIGYALRQTNGMNPAYLDTLGMLLARAGRPEEAYGIWQDALTKARPEDADVVNGIKLHLKQLAAATMAATAPATAPGTMRSEQPGPGSRPALAPSTAPAGTQLR